MKRRHLYLYRSLFMVSVTALMTTGIVHERQSMYDRGRFKDAYVDTYEMVNNTLAFDINYNSTNIEKSISRNDSVIKERLELTKTERKILLRIAMAEAEGEDTKGKALVMMVVLNRAYGSNEFPDSIYKVVHQKNQFSPVSNGRYYRVKPSKDCKKALEMVISGWDKSDGALYFESHKNPDNWHSRNLKYLFTHGGHRFYK